MGGKFEADITPPIVRYLLNNGSLKMVPREIDWYTICRDVTLNHEFDVAKPRTQYLRVGTNPNFFPLDGIKTNGIHGSADNGTNYTISGGRICYPTVYYASEDGFIVSCRRGWAHCSPAKKDLLDGTGDILARRSKPRRAKIGDKTYDTFHHEYLVRKYRVLKTTLDHITGYRRVCLSDECCGCVAKYMSQAAIILTIFMGPRPDNNIPQHDGEVWDDSLEMLRWITNEDNRLKENLDPK